MDDPARKMLAVINDGRRRHEAYQRIIELSMYSRPSREHVEELSILNFESRRTRSDPANFADVLPDCFFAVGNGG